MKDMYLSVSDDERSMGTEQLKEIGKKIRYFRKQMGLSLEGLAARSGVDPKYIGEIERSNTNPSILIIMKIARGLDREVAELFDNMAIQDLNSLEKIKVLVNGKCEKKVEKILKALELLLD